MAFDGIISSAVVAELNNSILNGKVNKIFQPNNNEILLGIYNIGKNYCLNISIDSINYRMNLTTHSKPNPQNVLNFCMVLRKHLTGATIRKIYMDGLERTVYIDIACYNELNDLVQKTLIVELMGKHSNVILVNEKNIIIDSLRHLNTMDNSIRDIFPGCKYVTLENSKIDFYSCTFDNFYKLITAQSNNVANISSAISNIFIGFSSFSISNLISNLGLNDDFSISLDEYKKIYQSIKNLLSTINNNCSNISCVSANNKKRKDYFLTNAEQTEDLQINFFIDDFYFTKESSEQLVLHKNNLLHLILNKLKKLEEKLQETNQKLLECSNMEKYKLYGELITANLYKIPNYNQSSITLENYYDNNKEVKINLDQSLNPSGNAKKFFKKYRKLQNAYSIVQKQKKLIEIQIDYLESIVYEINDINSLEEYDSVYAEVASSLDLNKYSKDTSTNKSPKELSYMPSEYKIDGFTVLVGKNNKQNDYLTCKLAKNSDLWFHTKEIHGSHVVLKLAKNSKADIDSIVYKCATIAAFFSKAKLSQNVPVDYTYIKYVKKPNGAKPGMVIYTDNKTLYVNPKNPNEYK